MKWVTVQEYAVNNNITLAAVYKQIKENRVKSDRKFGRLVVAMEPKKEAV